MKSIITGVVLTLLLGVANADELADAAKAVDAKQYPQAIAAYTRLANAGNAEAQLRLGELYWYGEGTALDRAKGDALFAKAAAAGNAEAATAQGLTAERAKHLADIAYWSTQYDGKDLTAGTYACAAPTIPAVSKSNAEIAAVTAGYDAYRECYNGFVANIASAMPAGKRIPVAIATVMSDAELTQSKQLLEKVYLDTAAKARARGEVVLAQREAWASATQAYVAEDNKKTAVAQLELDNAVKQRQYERSSTPTTAPMKMK